VPDDALLKERMMKKTLITAALLLIAMGPGVQAQDVAAGEQSFRKCLPCHAVGEGAKNKVGPILNGLDGRHSGTVEGYNYSDANKNSGITWDEAQFLDYIKDPRAKIKGTKMIFPGIKNENESKNLWAYLKQFGPDGKPK
jgi:cytochrome c